MRFFFPIHLDESSNVSLCFNRQHDCRPRSQNDRPWRRRIDVVVRFDALGLGYRHLWPLFSLSKRCSRTSSFLSVFLAISLSYPLIFSFTFINNVYTHVFLKTPWLNYLGAALAVCTIICFMLVKPPEGADANVCSLPSTYVSLSSIYLFFI